MTSYSQLFSVRPVDMAYSATRFTNGIHIHSQHIPVFPFMYWPSRKPCEPVNMYFLDIAHTVTGDSLKTYASELSHLVRYCGRRNIGFADLTDEDFFTLSDQLQKEKSSRNPTERARNNNTVRSIFSRAIGFLQWYQMHFVSALSTPLIGEASSSPQIIIKQVRNQATKTKRAECYFVHRAMPTRESREPKRPIARPIIEDIERCIDELSILGTQSARFVQRYRNSPNLLTAQLDYMRSRRHFMVWLMKRTGLRPAELIEINITDHASILQNKRLLIPTKKRRRIVAPKRSFPITLKDALIVQRYLTARMKYCEALAKAGVSTDPGDALFIGVGGRSIKKTSLERDFARLVSAAGYQDVQACFSMFRHRFITYEVVVHLKEFMVNTGKSNQMITTADYESILKRVATKTGHGSVQSIWHYIDLAWKEIDVWGGVDKAIERLHAADRLHDDLLALKREVEVLDGSLSTKAILKDITDRLSEIITSAKQDIDVLVKHGKHS